MKNKISYIALYICSHRMGRVSVCSSLILTLLCAITLFYYLHLESLLESTRSEYSINLEKIKYADSVNSLASVISNDRQLVENTKNKLVRQYSSAQIIDDFNALAKKGHLKIESQVFDSNGVDDENKYLNITISGAYKNIRLLFEDIHALPYWVEITNADMVNDTVHDNVTRCQMRLVIHG